MPKPAPKGKRPSPNLAKRGENTRASWKNETPRQMMTSNLGPAHALDFDLIFIMRDTLFIAFCGTEKCLFLFLHRRADRGSMEDASFSTVFI